jgi:TatD DNase family protein
MPLVDMHCHIDLDKNWKPLLTKIVEQDVIVLTVSNRPDYYELGASRLQVSPNIKLGLGFHPQLVDEDFEKFLPQLEALIPGAKFIGEIGLDGSGDHKDYMEFQEEVLSFILRECSSDISQDRVLSLHTRKAEKKTLDILEDHPDTGTPVLHWFTGSLPQAKRALELGAYFSINPKMTKTKKGKELISVVPLNRIFTETDYPFVDVKPWEVHTVEDSIAQIKGVSPQEVNSNILNNFRSLT